MKRASPKLSGQLASATIQDLVDDGELESVSLKDESVVNCSVAAPQLIDVRIDNVQLTGAHFSRIVARDVSVARSDFSAAHLNNGLLVRVEFVNCRMNAIDFSYSAIHDVTFKDCLLDRAHFEKADLRRVAFIDCSLQSVDFSTARLFDVTR